MRQLRVSKIVILIGLLLLAGCLYRQATPSSSDLQANYHQETIEPRSVAIFLRQIWEDRQYAPAADRVLQDPLSRFWQNLDQDITPVTLKLPSSRLTLSEHAIRELAAKNRRIRAKTEPLFPNLDAYLQSRQINGQLLNQADFTAAWLTLTAFVTGDETLADSLPASGFGLAGVVDRGRELIHLAKIGKSAYDSFGFAIAVAMDPETWELVKRNRDVLRFAAGVTGQLGKANQEAANYSRMIRQVLRASDVISNMPEDW